MNDATTTNPFGKSICKYSSDEIITRYKAAFLAANKKPIDVVYRNGRFQLSGICNDNFRRKDIIGAICVLERRHENETVRTS